MATEPMSGTAAQAPAEETTIVTRKRRPVRLILMLVVPALLLIGGIYMYMTSGRSVSTDDAQVKQDIVSVSAQVNGPIEQVFVKDGAHVKRGQLLFRIDPQPYQVALEQAEAQLAAARLQTQQLVTQAAGTGADITGAQANLKIKQNAFARQQALLKQGFTTRADYEDALNEVRTAETQLADARARSNNAQAAIAPGGNQPQIAQAQAAVDKARLDLSRTTVRAPMDGVVENSENLQIGQMAVQGVGMLSIVHSATAWVEANFKEKDLARMVPGQRASIEVDAYGQKFPAHVRSVGAGTGSEFSLLPAQNANGNWVKVTQRVPVRIAFDGTPSRPMIAGLSVTATVYFDDNGSAKSGK